MKPLKSPQDQPSSFQLFQAQLENLISPDHPLVHLAHLIQWTRFDEAYAPFYCEDNGAPGLPTRLMVGLQYLKYTYNLSDGVGAGSYRNEENDRFITQGQYRQLLEACPCQEWRVIITLARIGGLHPNEIKSLRWSDIGKIKDDRFRAVNSKMRHNAKLFERDVPLFPEIVEELDKLRQGNEDKEFVINRSPHDWSAQFHRIAESAGLDRIPRPFDNMRASRATEVCNEYGAKRESVWLSHSEKTAMKYYLMVTDDDYAIAAGRRMKQI